MVPTTQAPSESSVLAGDSGEISNTGVIVAAVVMVLTVVIVLWAVLRRH